MMTRENYNKFIVVAQKELPCGLSIHNYQTGVDFTTPFTKIMDDNTTIVQQDGTVSGVFLDITVYDRIPQNTLAHLDNLLWKVSQVVMIGKVKAKTLKQHLRNLTLSTFLSNRRAYLKFFQNTVERFGRCQHYKYAELFGAFANTTLYEPSIFENYSKIEFEGKKYMIVRDYISYLITRYNRTDFREPKEKQTAPHYRYVNFDMSYKLYRATTLDEKQR